MDKLALGRRAARPAEVSLRHLVRAGGRGARRGHPSGEPRAARELRQPHLALRARRIGEPAHARAERRLSRRATLRSTAGSPSPPTARPRARPTSSSSTAARRGRSAIFRARSRICAGPATAAQSSCSPPIAGSTAAPPNGAKRLAWGDEEDPAVDNPTDARRRLFRIDAATGATAEVGPADLSVWEFDLLGDRRRGRARLGRPERARLVSRAPRPDRLRVARGDGPASIELAAAGARGIALGRTRRLPRRMVERPRTGRQRDPDPRHRDRQAFDHRGRRGVRRHDVPVARRGEPLVRRLVEARRDLRRRRDRRKGPLVAPRGRRSSARTASPPDFAGAGQDRASPRCARPSASRPRSCSRRRPTRPGSRSRS